jgi:hypothetical protein
MNSISFKNLKLFKSKPPSAQKSKNSPPSPEKEKRLPFLENLIKNPFLYLFLFVLVLAYFTSYLPSKSLPELQVGEISSLDIMAPADLTIVDKETTEKRKTEAERAVLPVYNFDRNIFLNTEEKIRNFFSSGREWVEKPVTAKRIEAFQKEIFDIYGVEISSSIIRALAKIKFSSHIEETLINLIGKVSEEGIVLSKNLFIHGEQEKGLTLQLSPEKEKIVKVEGILDIEQSKQRLSEEISNLDLTATEKSVLTSLSYIFISENLNYNKIETDERKTQARNREEPVFYTIKKGKVIVRKGDEVTSDAVKHIQIINQNLKAKPSWWANFSGTFLLFGLLFLTLWYYLKSLQKYKEAWRSFLMMGSTLVLSVLLYKISILLAQTFSENSALFLLRYLEPYQYAFPFQFGVFVFAFLTGSTTALIFVILNSLLIGYLFKANFYLMIFCLIGGFAAIYGIKYYGKQKRTSPFRAGLFVVAPVNTFVIITFHLIKERMGSLEFFVSEILMGILGGILSAALAFVFLPVFEHIFGFVTQTKLLELSNSDLPIFKRMAIEAPGSYHHSLLVSTLAEKASKEIKVDPMLVKAGALYHDIGKLKRPEYFIENRPRNPDMHKDLKPSMSTLVIINHVKEGLEQAKKLKLPRILRNIIEQHHGTSLVRYFFHKAKKTYDPGMQKIGDESYRYAGPKPRSKEAALIMLADAVEAASRSLTSHTEDNFKRVITEIFNSHLEDGQLDECDFSLKELRAIAASFLSSLDTIYQKRVEYPGFDFEMKKKRKKNAAKTKKSNDTHTQPAKKILDKNKNI